MTTATRTRRGYSRENVQTHSQGYYGPQLPAVDVKVRGSWRDVSLPLDLGQVSEDGGATFQPVTTPEGFSREWLEGLPEDMQSALWERALESGWESLRGYVAECFPNDNVSVCAEGRSGGWAVVTGLPEIEEWDAVLLARWRKFERLARAEADDIPRAMAELAYLNLWDNPAYNPDADVPVEGLA